MGYYIKVAGIQKRLDDLYISKKICPKPQLFKRLKPSISTHSNPRTMPRMRLLKCFVLQHSIIKTKHLRSLVWRLLRGFEWVEILGFPLPITSCYTGYFANEILLRKLQVLQSMKPNMHVEGPCKAIHIQIHSKYLKILI